MKLARVAVIGVALVAGLAAALLARQLISRPKPVIVTETAAPVVDTTDVLVASRDLPMGSALDAGAFQWQSWPKSGVASAYINREARPDADTTLTGSIARTSFVAGEPINEAKLIRSDRGFMSAILPAGQRAVATAISADTSAGGFILPNDRVDVISSRRERNPDRSAGGAETVNSEIILSNVRVLAIDQTVEEKNGQKVVVGKTATLELKPEQSETLARARQLGTLSLALRSIADSSEPEQAEQRRRRGESINIVRYGVSTTAVTQK